MNAVIDDDRCLNAGKFPKVGCIEYEEKAAVIGADVDNGKHYTAVFPTLVRSFDDGLDEGREFRVRYKNWLRRDEVWATVPDQMCLGFDVVFVERRFG